MIKLVDRSPLCPMEMEMQRGQRLIIPLYSPHHSNISPTAAWTHNSTENINKKYLKHFKEGFLTAHYFFYTQSHLVGGGGDGSHLI